MSDLYLVLRNRLDAVPEWVYIDAAILRAARERKGLSYETMSREIPVSAKTWERYEKAGRIPRPILVRVAELLDLEIEQPARQRVTAVEKPREGDQVAALEEKLDELKALVVALDRKWDVADLAGRIALLEREVRAVATAHT